MSLISLHLCPPVNSGVRLHVVSKGVKGRPLVLFLHGFPECWYVCLYIVCVCMYVCMYVCVYVCMCVFVYVHVYMYICGILHGIPECWYVMVIYYIYR